MTTRTTAVLACTLLLAAPARAEWATYRGNPQRTGNLDDQPGPKAPKVLWVYKAAEHYVASPVPGPKGVYVGGLGAFNTGVFHCLSLPPDAPSRMLWSKTAPFIRRPIVSAPAVVEGLVIFGDGMHQTDDALLYCLHADTGHPIWQLNVPGHLIHIEGGPTVDRGRVFVGGGEAGILCVDLTRAALDGQEHNLDTIHALVEKRWAELLAKYEQDRKQQGDLALPPSEDALPKATPKLLWQVGQAKWHVDAPVAVAGDFLLAASARVEEDKVGTCSLVCLKAADGALVWETPLKVNPWAGPTLYNNTVLVACSSIRYDRKKAKDATGEIVALDLATGQVKWRKDLPGGILAPIAVKSDLAVFTATDGKVRAWSAATGDERWAVDAGNPFFAGPAIAGGGVYVADLKGTVHALALPDGKLQWKYDLTTDTTVLAPGMVYGSPAVQGGDLYIATCNVEADNPAAPCVVVCLSDKTPATPAAPAPTFAVDPQKRTLTIPCKIALRKLPTLKEVYPLEVAATYPAPMGQKAHETIVTFEVKPSAVHKALEELGLKPGSPARGDESAATGPEVRIAIEVPVPNDKPRLVPLEKAMVDAATGKPIPQLKWYFTGSVMTQPDPDRPLKLYGADLGGTLVAIFPVTDETVFQSNLTMKESRLLKLETNKAILPDIGSEAKLVIDVSPPREAPAVVVRPRPAIVPLPPLAAAPLPVPSDALVAVPTEPWLPLAALPAGPRLLPTPLQNPVGLRPATDRPPLAPEPYVALPRRLAALDAPPSSLYALRSTLRINLPQVPKPAGGYGCSTPHAPIPLPPPRQSPVAEGDPTEEQARDLVLAVVPDLKRDPAPFLLLALPDPFELTKAVPFRQPPPDDDPPAPALGLPGKPTLPAPEGK